MEGVSIKEVDFGFAVSCLVFVGFCGAANIQRMAIAMVLTVKNWNMLEERCGSQSLRQHEVTGIGIR